MFRRRFKNEIEFSEESFFESNKDSSNHYSRIVYVIHNRQELLSFLQENKNSNALVCLFDKQFHRSLIFLEVMNNLILFDESKTSREVLKELKNFFKRRLDSKNEKASLPNQDYSPIKHQNYYQAMYFLI